MTQSEINKPIIEENSSNYHTVNMIQFIPILGKSEKYNINTSNKFHKSKKDKKLGLSIKNTLNNNNETIKVKQNTTSLIHNPNHKIKNINNINNTNNINNNISIIQDSILSTLKTNNKNNISVSKKDFSSIVENEVKSQKDPVIAFFNRNFYSCEVPVPKKIVDNQKILDYYIKDKEKKEKYKQLLKLKHYSNNKMKLRNMNNLKQNQYKKNNIKQSLMLNDFRLYNRIHQVVRFWNKFINYACPIFQVQKFSLNNNISSSMDKSCLKEKNIKLPKLYTNSSKVFKNGLIKEHKFLRRYKSTDENKDFKY